MDFFTKAVEKTRQVNSGQLEFLRVPLAEIPQEDKTRMKKWYGGSGDVADLWRKYMKDGRTPSPAEQGMFNQALVFESTKIAVKTKDVEHGAYTTGKDLNWKGSVLTVDGERNFMNTIPRTRDVPQSVLQGAAVMASIYGCDDGRVTFNYPPANAAAGPFSVVSSEQAILTGQNYAEAAFKATGISQKMAAPEVAKLLVSAASRETEDGNATKALLVQGYNAIMSKLAIDVEEDSVQAAPNVEITQMGTFSVTTTQGQVFHSQQGGVTAFPITRYPVKQVAQKERVSPFMRQMSEMRSKIPSMLQKYYGCYGFPGKNQRFFMNLLHMYAGVDNIVFFNPPSGILDFVHANCVKGEKIPVYYKHITAPALKKRPRELTKDDVLLRIHEQIDREPSLEPVGQWKEIHVCKNFDPSSFLADKSLASQWTVGYYKLPFEGLFYLVPKTLAPKQSYGVPFTVVQDGISLTMLGTTMTKEALKMAVTGVTSPNRAIYADLKYPARYLSQGDDEVLTATLEETQEIFQSRVEHAVTVSTQVSKEEKRKRPKDKWEYHYVYGEAVRTMPFADAVPNIRVDKGGQMWYVDTEGFFYFLSTNRVIVQLSKEPQVPQDDDMTPWDGGEIIQFKDEL